MHYSVKQLAKLAGVSVRTLHYYDEIGLLSPSFIKDNGYRVYEEKEMVKLQQILFFRELEFPLNSILTIVNAPDFDRAAALQEQKTLLTLKKKRLEKLIATIDKTLDHEKGGENMTDDDLFASFNDDELVENMKEAKKRWGDTAAYKQSMERIRHWTKEDYAHIKEEGKKFTQTLADAMDKDIKSPEVFALIEQHHKGIETFYDCSYEMYRGLAQLYVNDPRFTTYYENFRPGLALWLRDAIGYYCDEKEKNRK